LPNHFPEARREATDLTGETSPYHSLREVLSIRLTESCGDFSELSPTPNVLQRGGAVIQ
jgi:hypothetical protein